MGIEPTLAAWEAAVLPLNYTRVWRHLSGIAASGNHRRRDTARHQNCLPKVANRVASLPPPCNVVTLAPMLASMPNSSVRAPICRVR
jgi:hypothetical protein